jgi:hypothetical protein
MAFVTLVALPDHLAAVVGGALQAEGISVRLEREPFAAVYGLTTGRWATRVMVDEGDVAQARELLAEVEAGEAGDA